MESTFSIHVQGSELATGHYLCMTQNISPDAENRREQSRKTDGKFGHQVHSEAGVDLPVARADVIEVEDGDSHDIQADGEVFDRACIANSDGYIVEGTIYENFHHCLPDDIEKFRQIYSDEQISDYFNNRAHVITDFVNNRYKNVQLDPGPDDTFAFDFHVDLDGPTTEEDAAEKLWEESDGVKFKNEMDPGTFGAEDVSALIRGRLAEHDATKLPNPEIIDEQAKQKFVDEFVSTAVLDAQTTAEEQYFMETGIESDIGGFKVDEESMTKLKATAGKFYEENAGDLEAWHKDVSGRKEYMNDGIGGHDAYMVAAHHGVGYRDRVPATDLESRIMAERLETSASEEIRSLEDGATREGKTLYFEGI